MADELTDSQLLEVARLLDQEVKSKQNAAVGLRLYVQNKQKMASQKQESIDLDKEIAGKRKLLEETILAHNQRLAELDNDFAMKKAAKETELEDYGAKLGAQIDDLKTVIRTLAQNALMAEKNVVEVTKKAQSDQNKKFAAMAKAEKEKVDRNAALDEEFQALSKSLDELKSKHGLK